LRIQRQTHEEKRRAIRAGELAIGTLACWACDAPVSPGEHPLPLTAELCCPYCEARGPVRGFLSLSSPARPARVVVRVRIAV
jgi:hypothetical protein